MWASKFLTFWPASFGLIESDGVFRLLEIEEEGQEFLGPTLREAWSGPVKANQPGLPPLQGVWNSRAVPQSCAWAGLGSAAQLNCLFLGVWWGQKIMD